MSYLTTTTTTTVTSISPNSARRVRTDLKTSENIYLTSPYNNPTRSRTSSPINIKLRPQHSTPPYTAHHQNLYIQGHHINTHDRLHNFGVIKSNMGTATTMQDSAKSHKTSCRSTNIPIATTTATVANTRKYLKRSEFILTAAKHVVDDSRILSTSAPHEGSTYLRSCLMCKTQYTINNFNSKSI